MESLLKRAIVLTALTHHGIIYKAGVELINDADPEFGRNFKTPHKRANLVLGRIHGIQDTEDMKHTEIRVVFVNTHGKPLREDGKVITETFRVPIEGDYEYNEERWTTDIKQAEAQVEKINDQFVSGLLPIIKLAQGHVDSVEAAKACRNGGNASQSEERTSPFKEESEEA